MACRSQTILSSLFQGRSTFKPAPVKEKSSIRQVPSAILPILNYRDPLYLGIQQAAQQQGQQPGADAQQGPTGNAGSAPKDDGAVDADFHEV